MGRRSASGLKSKSQTMSMRNSQESEVEFKAPIQTPKRGDGKYLRNEPGFIASQQKQRVPSARPTPIPSTIRKRHFIELDNQPEKLL